MSYNMPKLLSAKFQSPSIEIEKCLPWHGVTEWGKKQSIELGPSGQLKIFNKQTLDFNAQHIWLSQRIKWKEAKQIFYTWWLFSRRLQGHLLFYQNIIYIYKRVVFGYLSGCLRYLWNREVWGNASPSWWGTKTPVRNLQSPPKPQSMTSRTWGFFAPFYSM